MSDAVAGILAAVGSAALTGMITLIITIINSRAQHKTYIAELDKHNALQDVRQEQIEKKVDQLEAKVDQYHLLEKKIIALEERVTTLFEKFKDIQVNKI